MHVVLQDTVGRWSNREIHDTVAAIAAERIFAPARQSLLGRLFAYVVERIAEFINLIRGSPDARLLVITAMVAVGIVIVARILVTARAETTRTTKRGAARVGTGRPDAWSAARELAATGDFTAACHALYAAVLDALARSGSLKRHSSKTSGDYARELMRRGSPAVHDFRVFAGDFDRVIYGRGEAFEADYLRLAQAAERAVGVAAAA